VTTDIIHLHDYKLHQYKGNFAQFEEMYEQRRREVGGACVTLDACCCTHWSGPSCSSHLIIVFQYTPMYRRCWCTGMPASSRCSACLLLHALLITN
jgi:hypothetical protein